MAEKGKSELNRIFPGEKYTLETGEDIAVVPLRFEQLSAFTGSVSSLFTVLSKAGIDNLTDPESWPMLFDSCFEEVVDVMGTILEREALWVRKLRAGDAIGLLGIIIEQNMTDLTKKNIHRLVAAIKGAMPTSPNTSSQTDGAGGRSNA